MIHGLVAVALLAGAPVNPETTMDAKALKKWVEVYATLWDGNLAGEWRSRLLADRTVIVASADGIVAYGPEGKAWRFEIPDLEDGNERRVRLSLPGRTIYSHFKKGDAEHAYWPAFDGPAIDRTDKDYVAPKAMPLALDAGSTEPLRAVVLKALRALPEIVKRGREATVRYRGDEHVDRGYHRTLTTARKALAEASADGSPLELAAVAKEIAPRVEAEASVTHEP